MAGFFSPVESKAKSRSLPTIAACGACKLYVGCKTPKMKIDGLGRKKILIVDSHPNRNNDGFGSMRNSEYFGQLVTSFGKAGIDLLRDCWYTSAIICRPHGRDPTNDQIGHCRPNIFNAIKERSPVLIILLGGNAVNSVIGHIYKSNPGGIETWHGFSIPSQELNAWVCPILHPKDFKQKTMEVERLIFNSEVKAALTHKEHPWPTKPEFEKKVEIIWNEDRADEFITELIDDNREVAFDYEATALKPHNSDSKIVCVSFSNGKRTGVFQMTPRTMKACRAILRDRNIGKIGANMKYEIAWSIAKLGVLPRPWKWDVTLAAHIEDNRPMICGLKFQAFTEYGQPLYSTQVDSYLQSKKKGGYALNRATECDKLALMLYCGLDSLFTILIAKRQRNRIYKGSDR